MGQDLTRSAIDRQNILNNPYALEKVEAYLDLGGVYFEGQWRFTKQHLTRIFAISESTVEKYVANSGEELRANGYEVLKGKKLKAFKSLPDVSVTDYGNKTPALGVFTFRATINLAMLLTESEPARVMRSRILDIVIDVMAERAGGQTKYINQRDRDYLPAAFQQFNYRKRFTDALRDHLDMDGRKYGHYTNKIYQVVFRENAAEYKQILKLAERDRLRDTLYAEVLKAIASVENGLADEMATCAEQSGRKLLPEELDQMLDALEDNAYLRPVIEDARTKMASRDLSFRDALHENLASYLQSVPSTDFDKFLGETSRSLAQQLSDPETLAVFKRLKDR